MFYFGNAAGDADGDRMVGDGDYDMLTAQFGLRGSGLEADFNGDDRVDIHDFSILQGCYGNTLVEPPVLPGDADGSGVVDGADYDILIGQFGLTGQGLVADFNSDRRVDLADFAILRSNYGNRLVEPPVLLGDADRNGVVDDGDYEILIGQFGLTGQGLVADFDGDGRVGLEDYAILRTNFGNTLPAAPEAPATALQVAEESIAATGEYDLRPLSDDPVASGEGDLLVDVLAESLLAIRL